MRRFDLLAKAVYQSQMSRLTRRIREQARSHIFDLQRLKESNHDPHLSIRDMFVREHAITPISCVCR